MFTCYEGVMVMNAMTLELLPSRFAICRLLPEANLFPDWLQLSRFQCVVSTDQETSILCEEKLVPPEIKAEGGWRGLRIVDSLDFNMVGVLESVLQPLAQANISILALSTFETDYVFVKQDQVDKAVLILEDAGFRLNTNLENISIE